MNEAVVAVFIPIVFFLVAGLVMVTFFYLKSREKQMLIEKGLSSEEIKQFYEKKKDNFILLKIGIISVFFGLGLGIGMALQDNLGRDYWIPLSLFTMTGLGLIVSNLAGNSMRKKETEYENK